MPDELDPDRRGDTPLAPEREARPDPDRIISQIPIRPYHRVADIGCGSGFFTVPLAKYVSQGKLYALDTQDKALEECRRRLSEVRLTNVEVLSRGARELPLERESLDGALLAFVLHQAPDREGLLKAVAEILQRGGWLALLEWYGREREEGLPLEQRLEEAEARRLGEGAGLRYVSQRDLDGKSYMVLFRK